MAMLLWVLLVAFTLTYVGFFGFVAKPEWSLYGYLVIWIAVPKAFRLAHLSGGLYDLPRDITLFPIIETIAALAILVAASRARRTKVPAPEVRRLVRWSLILLAVAVVTLVMSSSLLSAFASNHVQGVWHYVANALDDPMSRIVPVVSVFGGVAFLYGCSVLIRTQKQVDGLLLIFVVSGIELGIETILLSYLNLFPELSHFTLAGGRFKSIVFTNYDIVGVFAILGFCASWYFMQRRKTLAVAGLLLSSLPMIQTYQRAVLMGAIASALLIYWLTARRQSRALVGIGLGLAVILVLGLGSVRGGIGHEAGGTVRPDYFSGEQLKVRVALWTRGIEVFRYMSPFGTGGGTVRYAMNDPAIGANSTFSSKLSTDIYASEVTGARTTNTHNLFIEFVTEYGLAGLALLAALIISIGRQYFRYASQRKGGAARRTAPYRAQVCAYAALLGVAVHGLFEATTLPYAVLFLFVFLIFRLPSLEDGSPKERQDASRDWPTTETALTTATAIRGRP